MTNKEAIEALKRIRDEAMNEFIGDCADYEAFGIAIKALKVVTCGECKHWDDRRKDEWWSEEGACYRTSRLGHATYRNHDDFCSRGERNSSEKPNNSKERSSE